MKRPDFKELKLQKQLLIDLRNSIVGITEDEQLFQDAVRRACAQILGRHSLEMMKTVPVEELSKSKAGIRVSSIVDAGYRTLYDIASADSRALERIPGIGRKQAAAILNVIAEFNNNIMEYASIKLSSENPDDDEAAVLIALTKMKRTADIRREAEAVWPVLLKYADDILSRLRVEGRLRWIFASDKDKTDTAYAYDDMRRFLNLDPIAIYAGNILERYTEAATVTRQAAIDAFKKNSADYYALLENIAGSKLAKPLIYSSVSAKLAQDIDAFALDTSGFKGNLRAYQTFGVKYILHQKRTLLGDEMGLGKTVQAIAAMAHIYAETPYSHFMVICPASVLVNWIREVEKFSDIPAYLIHGEGASHALGEWKDAGGVAVTNFETMNKIIAEIDEVMSLKLLVIDEAHYIKNPDAKRTRIIRKLDNEAENILLMTGTPLENRVGEMCNLIDFIHPEVSDAIRSAAYMSKSLAFREMIAPFYLRRLRADVLKELPPIDHVNEWCALTTRDAQDYERAVFEGTFNEIRRVSYLSDIAESSAKLSRLREICEEAREDGRKMVIYSFFLDTVDKVAAMLGSDVSGVITGSTPVPERQEILDRFSAREGYSALVCQIQAGGTGVNIQEASIVVFCEPQIKPSLEKQALSRVYRMGQTEKVLVFHLLCPDTVDEAMMQRLAMKEEVFMNYAEESALAEANDNLFDSEWIREFIQAERKALTENRAGEFA